MKDRPEISLCGLQPKPLDKCKSCYRNDENTKPEPLQTKILPPVTDDCSYYIPVRK